MIFGIPETTDRITKNSVDGLFAVLDETPKVNSMKRIGERNEKGPRPLLVSLERRATLLALLKKSRQLKESEQFKAVYLSPDLNPIQLKERKALLSTLKKLREDDPGGKYFIKNNIIQVG